MSKQRFLTKPNKHPKTDEVIVIGSNEYLKLVKKYGEPNKIKSPKSNRLISVNKGEYKKLIHEGYTDESLINPKVIKIDNVIQQLINSGNMNELNLLSQVNKPLKEALSKEENIKTLMYITNLNQYYTLDDVSDFDELYFLYVSLNDRKDILKYIKQTFTLQDYERAVEVQSNLIGRNYEEFMSYQWTCLLEIDDRKRLNFLKYLVDVGGGFGFIDKVTMIQQFNTGIVFDSDGNLCLTL